MDGLAGVEFIQGDFREAGVLEELGCFWRIATSADEAVTPAKENVSKS